MNDKLKGPDWTYIVRVTLGVVVLNTVAETLVPRVVVAALK
jgi:hypothetical protein